MKSFLLTLLLTSAAAFGDSPLVSKYDQDLVNIPGMTLNEVSLMSEVRANARANLTAKGEGGLIDPSYYQQQDLKNCGNGGPECVSDTLIRYAPVLGQSPGNHNPGDVNCTGKHQH